jgi:hypothetical protein
MLNYPACRAAGYHATQLESTLAHEALHAVAQARHDDRLPGGSSSAANYIMATNAEQGNMKWVEGKETLLRAISPHSKDEIYANMVPLMEMAPLQELFLRRLFHPTVWVKGESRYNCLMSEWVDGWRGRAAI